MNSPVRILDLEDNPRDADLNQEMLAAEGISCEIVRVDTFADFDRELDPGGFDLIISDYTLPSFDGRSASKPPTSN